ncbi:uncharacterized protein LOC119072042 isoform X2 [Bradysia coprophila]|uniref:uncharacterized protein LOC119072042 isoform X2 n=1 Tax=Bradysia coprophila TaxID=38358 RepID=UPI00187DCE0F|nr:uncharacterized protein LOC119072042 isoform X2 [Bradysia coprophila]
MSYNWESNCGYKPIAQWVRVVDGNIPNKAIGGGQDLSGENLYVGRVEHQGDIIPGKVVPSQGICFVPYAGKEHGKSEYQVLMTDEDIVWTDASYGEIPTGAIQGGVTVDGERLYIGRVKHMGAMCVGKIHPSHQVCFISFDGREFSYSLYSALCVKHIPLVH